MRLIQHADKTATMAVRAPKESDPEGTAQVHMTVEIEDEIGQDIELSDDAQARIAAILRREGNRIAEIAACDIRDQQVARLEAARIAKAPKNRPSILVMAGQKDPSTSVVERGTFEVGGRKMSAPRVKE